MSNGVEDKNRSGGNRGESMVDNDKGLKKSSVSLLLGEGSSPNAATNINTGSDSKDSKEALDALASLPNYQPTTPANLSRRLLHRSGVGYLDAALPLLLSSLADRFLATVLVQATACRDRRLEGHDALRKEERRRVRHRSRVMRERRDRKRRWEEELKRRRGEAEKAVREAGVTLEHQSGRKGGATVGHSGVKGRGMFRLSEKDREAAEEYRKQTEEMDAEEDYYNAYYNRKGKGDGGSNFSAIDVDQNDDDDDDDSEAEEMPEDAERYDIQLRDLVRPLRAWGFDIASKPGLVAKGNGWEDLSDGDEDRGTEDAERSEDEEEDEEQEDDEAAESDEDEGGDPATTDDETGGPAQKKRKQMASPNMKKKSGPAGSAVRGGGGAQKGSGAKQKTAKRKRVDTEGGGDAGGATPNKKTAGKPLAKKTSVGTAAAAAMAKKTKGGQKKTESIAAAVGAGSTGVAGNSK